MDPAGMSAGRSQAHRLRTAVRAVVVLLVAVLSALAIFFWLHTEQAAVDQYNRTSLALARLGAKRIEETLLLAEKRLGVLSRSDCRDRADPRSCPLNAEEVLAELAPLGAIDVLRLDPTGQVVATRTLAPKVAQALVDEALTGCQPDQNACLRFVDGQASLPHQLALLAEIARPVRSRHHAVAVFDWSALGRKLTEDVALDPQRLAWLLDQDGRLLYHPSNPDICNEGTQRQDARCQVCHRDSEVLRQMQTGRLGVGSIAVAGSVPKLVAFAPLHIADRQWSLAVAVPYKAVVEDNREVLLVAVLISALLIGLFLVVTYFLDRENRRQIGALSENQATIRRLNADLEDKVRARTEQLRQVYNEISEFHRSHENRERLAIVGELAAVVAHEIRNPLNSLAINSERLLRKLRRDSGVDLDQARQVVEAQSFEVRRINEYIEQYLRLARPPRRRVVRADLNALVADLLKFLEVEAGRQAVRLQRSLTDRPLWVEIDQEQIRQVLLNLIINAFQAMPDGGELTVETDAEADSAVVRIGDTGVGIAKEILADVFKPFFTTREAGTGLGLAISARIVKEHRGELLCDSEVGRGTTFTIRLPLVPME